MARKRHSAEQIINKLREAEVHPGQGMSVPEVARKLRDELLNGEIFYTLREAKVLINRWRTHYNTMRPHS